MSYLDDRPEQPTLATRLADVRDELSKLKAECTKRNIKFELLKIDPRQTLAHRYCDLKTNCDILQAALAAAGPAPATPATPAKKIYPGHPPVDALRDAFGSDHPGVKAALASPTTKATAKATEAKSEEQEPPDYSKMSRDQLWSAYSSMSDPRARAEFYAKHSKQMIRDSSVR